MVVVVAERERAVNSSLLVVKNGSESMVSCGEYDSEVSVVLCEI
jgi:hypothetical protein